MAIEHDGCPHPFDLHAFLPTDGAPTNGGIMLCPVLGCQCLSTFGVGRGSPPPLPPQAEIDRLRTAVQTGEM